MSAASMPPRVGHRLARERAVATLDNTLTFERRKRIGETAHILRKKTGLAAALATLASAALAGWQSAAIDNGADLAFGALITLSVTLAAGAPAADKTVYVYVYESEDGAAYTDNATGAAGTLTRRDPTNMRLIGTIATPDTGGLTYKQTFAYAPAVMPRKWGLFVNNVTGLAFTAAAASYTPVQGQSV